MNNKLKERIEILEYNEKIKDIFMMVFCVIVLFTIGGIILFNILK